MTDITVASGEFEVVRLATSQLSGANDQNSAPLGDRSLESMALRWEDLGEKFDRIASFELLKGVAIVEGIDVPVHSKPFNESGYIYIGATAVPLEELSLYMEAKRAENVQFNLDQVQAESAVIGRSGMTYAFEEAKGDRILSLQDLR